MYYVYYVSLLQYCVVLQLQFEANKLLTLTFVVVYVDFVYVNSSQQSINAELVHNCKSWLFTYRRYLCIHENMFRNKNFDYLVETIVYSSILF